MILFVVDAQSGLTPLDHEFARLLRSRVKDTSKIVLVANKVDAQKHEAIAAEAMRLGFGEPIITSAIGKHGRHDLLRLLADRLGDLALARAPSSQMLLAIVGRRNAGKSTLVNTLAGCERVIASEIPGTTRDSVDVRFQVGDKTFTAIDTAGVRKRKSMKEDVEYYSLHRALRSIRRADVCILLIDATEPISTIEKHLGQETVEHYKPCIIAINKWDKVDTKAHPSSEFVDYLGKILVGLDYAPIVFISAKNDDGVRGLVKTACDLFDQAGQRVSTSKLNETIKEIFEQRGPSSMLGEQAKVYYATMTDVHPPEIVVFVNRPKLFGQNYQRYLLNQLRERLPYEEVPVKLLIRAKPRKSREEKETSE